MAQPVTIEAREPGPAPVPVASPTVFVRVFLGPIPGPGQPAFRNYLELPRRLPVSAWHAVRVVSVLAYAVLVAGLFIRPAGALFAFFKVIVPLLPVLFFVAPGLWRNLCPLAAANQAPRVLGFSRGLTPPAWLRRYGFIIALVLFFGIASARIALFDADGQATGILLAVTIASAFLAGLAFKGKSGWCSSICPLLPLQRTYGQTPFAVVPNSHCQPCVGCTKNCYDFKPQVAYQADLHDSDSRWVSPRRLFAAALPGFVLGFFTLVSRADLTTAQAYERLALYFFASIASFYLFDALLPVTSSLLTALYPAVAINIFYWYASVVLASSFQTVTGVAIPWARWPIRALVLALTIVWITHTYAAGRRFRQESSGAPAPVRVGRAAAGALASKARSSPGRGALPARRHRGGRRDRGQPARGRRERRPADRGGLPDGRLRRGPGGGHRGHGRPQPAGRRRAHHAAAARVRGQHPDGLLRPGAVRAGAGRAHARARRAARRPAARILRPVDTVRRGRRQRDRRRDRRRLPAPGPPGLRDPPDRPGDPRALQPDGHLPPGLRPVGDAGPVPAARIVVRRAPDHRLGSTRSRPDSTWPHGRCGWGPATCWATTGSSLPWAAPARYRRSRASGCPDLSSCGRPRTRWPSAATSSSTAPGTRSWPAPGCSGLRPPARSMSWACTSPCWSAANGCWPGRSTHDAASSCAPISVNWASRCATAPRPPCCKAASGPVRSCCKTAPRSPCEVFLAAVGIRPNIELAAAAGLQAGRGVLVDDQMRTSVPDVYAAGDVAEHNGTVLGLWTIAAKQAEVAAINAVGGGERLIAELPATILKGVGLELAAVGRAEPFPGEQVVVTEDASQPSYRRLVLAGGQVVGTVVLGHHPQDLTAATATDDVVVAVLGVGEGQTGASLPTVRALSQQRVEVAPVHFDGVGYLRIAAAPYNTPDDYDRLADTVRECLRWR